jgi:hypothetical protein
VGEEKSYLWAITAGRHFFFQLPAQAEIEKAVNAYLPFVNDARRIGAAHLVHGRELFDLILLPADSLIESAKKIIISADGILHAVPFESLAMPSQNRQPEYLIEHAEITYTPSLTVLSILDAGAKASSPPQSRALLAFADPFFGASESPQTAAGKRGEADSLTLRGLLEHLGVKFPRLNFPARKPTASPDFFPRACEPSIAGRRPKKNASNWKTCNAMRFFILLRTAFPMSSVPNALVSCWRRMTMLRKTAFCK